MVAAHRAAHSKYPENSIAAVKEAIKQGIDIAEIDVRATKDSVLVIMHDATILKTTGQPGKVNDYTYAELQKFPLLFNGQPTAEKIPTFDEVLKVAKDKILVDIDFKADEDYAMGKTIEAIVAHKMEAQVLFFLYDHKDAAQVRAINPNIPIMPRVHNVDETYDALAMKGQGYKFPVLHVDDSFYNDTTMIMALKKGVRVWINSLGKYDKMEAVTPESGFDQLRKDAAYANVLQTDYPERLLVYLRKKGLHK